MKHKLGNNGGFKSILLIFVLVVIAFVLISFGGPYYRYYTLSSHTRDSLKAEIGNIDIIRKNIMTNAEELKVPLHDSALSVVLVQKTIKVKATWSETVDFWGYYDKKLDFVMEEEY